MYHREQQSGENPMTLSSQETQNSSHQTADVEDCDKRWYGARNGEMCLYYIHARYLFGVVYWTP